MKQPAKGRRTPIGSIGKLPKAERVSALQDLAAMGRPAQKVVRKAAPRGR